VVEPGINTLEGYLTRPAADTLVTFEHFTGYDSYQSDAWTQRYLPTAFSHLCYSIASSVTMTNYVQLARSRNAAYIYVTDDTANNPWDTLPSYWESEVALIEQLNRQAATNRPATLRIMVMGTNTATITVAGSPGRYVLTGSTNLEKWQPIATNVSAAGIYAVSDPAPSKLPNRAYRTEQ
jgi:hypothetical protein